MILAVGPLRTPRRRALASVLLLFLVTSAGAADAGDLARLLTQLYPGDGPGITLSDTGHRAHFTGESLVELNTLSEDLTSALGNFATTSTVASYTFDFELGVPVRSTDSLGPIVSERATTIGGLRLNLGFSYNRLDYKRFEGDDLDDITLFFTHFDVNGDGVIGPVPGNDVETDRMQVDLDIDLAQNVFALYGTFGILDNLDVSISVPYLTVDLQAKAFADVERNAVDVMCPDGSRGTSACVHIFDPPDGDPMTSLVRGHANGFGDVLLRGKYHFLRSEEWRPNLAFVGQVRFPTGDEDDLLGTGDWRGMPMLVADKTFGWVTPHINLGFEIVGGKSDLNNLKYFVGFDARLHPRFTTVIDLLGRWEPSGDGIGDNLLDIAVGGKFGVFRSLVLVANFIVPLNRNQGLRPDFIWALGVEYTFGGLR